MDPDLGAGAPPRQQKGNKFSFCTPTDSHGIAPVAFQGIIILRPRTTPRWYYIYLNVFRVNFNKIMTNMYVEWTAKSPSFSVWKYCKCCCYYLLACFCLDQGSCKSNYLRNQPSFFVFQILTLTNQSISIFAYF